MKPQAQFLLLSIILLSFVTGANAKSKVRLKVIRGVHSQESSNLYFTKVLSEALSHNKHGISYQLEPVDFEFSQNRTLRLLNYDNVLDVTHSMTSAERELKYNAIKIPLLQGLYGKRKLLVVEKDKAKFENISLQALKNEVAFQGRHWPDFNRLRDNGFSVYGVNNYEANYKMLAKQRCSYFPRGVAEIQLDLNKYQGKFSRLAIVDSLLLVYDAPIYFFVGKDKTELAEQIEFGLTIMDKTGRLKQLLKETKAFHYNPGLDADTSVKTFQLN